MQYPLLIDSLLFFHLCPIERRKKSREAKSKYKQLGSYSSSKTTFNSVLCSAEERNRGGGGMGGYKDE